MKKIKSRFFGRELCIVVSILFILSLNGTSLFSATDPNPSIELSYDPIEYFVPEKRIVLEIEVSDKSGINLVRCYFQASGQKDYVFVPMASIKDGSYRAFLPAPSKETIMINYLFLVVNGKNQVFKTQTFIVKQKDEKDLPAWQLSDTEGNIQVYTESPEAMQPPAGFSDSITMDVVESSARFGLVAGGIYAATQTAAAEGISGAAAAASNGGTVTPSTGLSTGAWIGIGVGAAAVVGGGAAALGGGGGGDGGNSPQPPPTTTTTTTSSTTTTTAPSSTTTTTAPTTSTTTTTTTSSSTTSTTTTLQTECPMPRETNLEAFPPLLCGQISEIAFSTDPAIANLNVEWDYDSQSGNGTTNSNGVYTFNLTLIAGAGLNLYITTSSMYCFSYHTQIPCEIPAVGTVNLPQTKEQSYPIKLK